MTNEIIKLITMVVIAAVIYTLQSFWLQSILEHFNSSLHILACMAIVIVFECLKPKALTGLLLLLLFIAQCYIWII